MKTICLSAVIILIVGIEPGYSQSTFGFFNYVPSVGLDAPVFDAAGNRLSGTNYLAMLYGGPSVDSLAPARLGNSVMAPVSFTAMRNGQSGYFAGLGSVEIDTVPCCLFVSLQVRAWDARLGSSYETVAALGIGGYGESPLFQARGGDLVGGPPSQPLLGLQSFSLLPVVPEPSSFLLLLLGLPLFLFRHRWSK